MRAPFDATCLTIGRLLSGDGELVVPGYQRPYSWSTEQAGRLLDDLVQAIGRPAGEDEARPGEYFLGAIVLMETAGSEGGDPAFPRPAARRREIVDGVQRLVTLTILLAVLRDISEADDAEAAALAAAAVMYQAGPDAGGTTRPRLVLASDDQAFLRAHVQEPRATSAMPESDSLAAAEQRILDVREHLLGLLIGEDAAHRQRILDFVLHRCHIAVVSARTVDRAHQVFAALNDRGLPLTRGDILKAELLGTVDPARRASFDRRWNEMERLTEGALDELLAHIRTILGRARGPIIEDIRALIAEGRGGEAFISHTLEPCARIFAAITGTSSAATPISAEAAQRLSYLRWLGSQDWIAPLMLQWRLCDGDAARLDPFLARLDRLAYGLRLLGVGSDKRAQRYRALVEAIRNGEAGAAASPLELSRDEQRLILHNLRSLHARSQFACKLVLLRLNDAIAGAPQHLEPQQLTVEHVLPQKLPRMSEWRLWFADPDARERCTHSLGNLILVTRDRNERARNLELKRKLEIYFADDAEQPAITQDIKSLTRWGPSDVERREERLIAILTDLWQLGGGRSARPADGQPLPDAGGHRRRAGLA